MSIAATCEHCGKEYGVPENLAGKKARCAECGQMFTIPGPADAGASKSGTRVGGPGASKAGSRMGTKTGSSVTGSPVRSGPRFSTDPRTAALEQIAAGRRELDKGTQELIDLWVPRMLVWLSAGMALVGGIITAHRNFEKYWILGYVLMLTLLTIYWTISVPWCVLAVRSAERNFHFELPALTRRRIAITFAVPSAFGYFFFAYGFPRVWPAVGGLFFGLFAAFFIMWAVLHLDFRNAVLAFACATVLYLASVGVMVLAIASVLLGASRYLGAVFSG